jgi:hypothetical protein
MDEKHWQIGRKLGDVENQRERGWGYDHGHWLEEDYHHRGLKSKRGPAEAPGLRYGILVHLQGDEVGG